MKLRTALNACSGRMGRECLKAVDADAQCVLAGAFERGDSEWHGHPCGKIYPPAGDAVLVLPSAEIGSADFDVLIDFSTPEATIEAAHWCHQLRKPMVTGTTGFLEEQLAKLKAYAQEIPLLHAPNMSIGVNLCLQLLRLAGRTVGKDADIEILEIHHKHKADSPSGTALAMGQAAADSLNIDLKDAAVFSRHGRTGERKKGSIGFQAIRGSDVVGEHKVFFFMDGERVEITHKASNRKIYALGAVRAAKWLASQKIPGFFGMSDMISGIS